MSNRKTITITIENMPVEILNEVWTHSIKEGKKIFGGFVLTPTDNIKVDFINLCGVDEDMGAQLLGTAVTAHLFTAIHEKLNS